MMTECYEPLNEQAEMLFTALGMNTRVLLQHSLIEINEAKQSYVTIENKSELDPIIDGFPPHFYKNTLRSAITSNTTRNTVKIAEIETEEIVICSEYSQEQALRMYMNKQYRELLEGIRTPRFKKFINSHIDYRQIIDFVVRMVENLSVDLDIKATISECIVKLKN